MHLSTGAIVALAILAVVAAAAIGWVSGGR